MSASKNIRNIIVIASVIVFIYQSGVALKKFWISPTVIINSVTSWKKINKPRKNLVMSKLIELLTLKAYEVFVSADFINNFFSGLDMIILNT